MARPRDTIEARNYQRVLAYLMELVADPDLEITEGIIRRINAITLDGVPDLGGVPGEYKRRPNYVVNSATDEVVYRPPSPEATPGMMREFVEYINRRMEALDAASPSVDNHPVVLAAIVCHRLNHIHPFCDGNGRTARALATLILMRRGYMGIRTGDKLRPIMSLEWYLDAHRSEYAATLRLADQGQYHEWVLLFSLAVMETMEKIDQGKFASMRSQLEQLMQGEVAAAEDPRAAD